MARPAKLVDSQSRHNTKDEIAARKETENALKGSGTVQLPYELTDEQEDIFFTIQKMFEETELLGEFDGYVLAEAAVVIDRLQKIEKKINDEPELLLDKDIMSIRKGYTQDFFRLCNELSLSPQSRAKMGSIAAAKSKEKINPLKLILLGGNDDET